MKHRSVISFAVIVAVSGVLGTTGCKRKTAAASGVEDISAHRPEEPEEHVDALSGTHTGNTQHGFERDEKRPAAERLDRQSTDADAPERSAPRMEDPAR